MRRGGICAILGASLCRRAISRIDHGAWLHVAAATGDDGAAERIGQQGGRGLVVKIAIGAIVKNEAPYLREWVAYHKAVGVDAFIIGDNDSTDGTRAFPTALLAAADAVARDLPPPCRAWWRQPIGAVLFWFRPR